MTDPITCMADPHCVLDSGHEGPCQPEAETPTSYLVVTHGDGGDYYAGEGQALYVDGRLVWHGETMNQLDDIVAAIAGDDRVESLRVRLRDVPYPGGHITVWPEVVEAADWELLE